jgi:hypothetical protein
LLYWDYGVSLVPEEFHEDESELGPYMFELVKEKLIHLLSPDEIFMYNPGMLNRQFDELLKLYKPPGGPESWQWTRIHVDKFSDFGVDSMAARGLVRTKDPMEGWITIEKGLGDLWVAYLAGSACRQYQGFFPVTDSNFAQAGVMPLIGASPSFSQEWRYSAITKALPIPSRLIPPKEIRSFKDKHREELRRLRLYLNGHLAELATIQDADFRAARISSIFEEIKDELAIVRERMSKRRWPLALAGVGGVVASGLDIGATIASGGDALALGLGISAGAVAILAAFYGTAELIRDPRFDVNSPLAYAVLVEDL